MTMPTNGLSPQTLERWLNQLLDSATFQDYAPNGLQLDGGKPIQRLITGVTASKALLNEAIKRDANAIVVHHGWFWKNESPCIVGPKRDRIALALEHGISVLGYHLPLDAHPKLGNNAQLGKLLGLHPELNSNEPYRFGPSQLIWSGTCTPISLQDFSQNLQAKLKRQPLVLGDLNKTIQRVAWCTGGAQGMMQYAIDENVDLYITGEASEQNTHMARESGTAFIAAGHHATERYGPKALGEAIAKQFDLPVEFIDIDNPV